MYHAFGILCLTHMHLDKFLKVRLQMYCVFTCKPISPAPEPGPRPGGTVTPYAFHFHPGFSHVPDIAFLWLFMSAQCLLMASLWLLMYPLCLLMSPQISPMALLFLVSRLSFFHVYEVSL